MPVRPVLHGDNGATLKATTVLAMLHWLGIEPSYSRPRVSDDNAFAEALFRTAKYRPEFPLKGFADLRRRQAMGGALRPLVQRRTPPQRHPLRHPGAASCRTGWPRARRPPRGLPGRTPRNPQRWSGQTRNWTPVGAVTLNPERDIVVRAATSQIQLSGSIGEPAGAEAPMIPPTIARISPAGMERGQTVTFTIDGRSLSDASEVIFDTPGLSGKVIGITDIAEKITGPRAGEDLAAQVPLGKKQTARIEISAAKDAIPGVHRFRVKTPWGTSNLATFAVGTLPEIQRQEQMAPDSAALPQNHPVARDAGGDDFNHGETALLSI